MRPKYNINDTVYFNINNKLAIGEIKEIKTIKNKKLYYVAGVLTEFEPFGIGYFEINYKDILIKIYKEPLEK